MSHTVYSTDTIVLSRVETGEADVTLWLLTKELGLIIARAQSARKSNAKMRAHLQLFSLLRVSLVRGKYLWRVTGTEHVETSVQSDALDTGQLAGKAFTAFARVVAFVRRMTAIEDGGNTELFNVVLTIRQGLAVASSADTDELELVTVAKLLACLGYLDADVLSKYKNKDVSRNNLAAKVNAAIAESHL